MLLESKARGIHRTEAARQEQWPGRFPSLPQHPPLRPALQASHLCLPTAEPAEDPAGGGVRVKVGGRGEGLEGELEAA